MTIRLQEVVRSEVEGGLSGPANPIPSQSIDCGCAQIPCPKLAKFATRQLFVSLICWIGILQAASTAYFYVIGPSIARQFQLDPYIVDWILIISELTPFILGLTVAYWGDRIHRASWIGALVLLQCIGYLMILVPRLTHHTKVAEKMANFTLSTLYADDSPDMCTTSTSKIIIDDTCYFTIAILIIIQILVGMANIAYYALGISYLDDNTKKEHVAAYIGVIIAVKIIGVLIGYLIAWGCLRIDAENLKAVQSYQEQIGAWWLGFPILAVLLAIPGLLLSWFPRRLPSEVVEQAAAELLDRSNTVLNRNQEISLEIKASSPYFWPTFIRLLSNKVLMCNVLASVFSATALLNFLTYENTILEARFHIPRPTGMLLGFNDPFSSRLISNILEPVLIGLIVIIVGLVIARAKPRARFLAVYNVIVIILASIIIFSLTFTKCDKPPIVSVSRNSLELLRYCNKDCHCSRNADFRPVCDRRHLFTFYSPCHAGCTTVEVIDGVKIYGGCSCVEELTGEDNNEARQGPCGSDDCQIGWLAFEFGTMLAYALISTTFVGDFLINIRSVYKQDKASSIGFLMSWIAIFVNVPGKIIYQMIANMTCQHWGKPKSICHLHESMKFENYLCYSTTLLLAISALFKILTCIFCGSLKLYNQPTQNTEESVALMERTKEVSSLKTVEFTKTPIVPKTDDNDNSTTNTGTVIIAHDESQSQSTAAITNDALQTTEANEALNANKPLKYGPLGPGNRRNGRLSPQTQKSQVRKSRNRNFDSEDELESSSDESKRNSGNGIAYRPLDIDSDVESDLGGTGPRSRHRVVSKVYDDPFKSNSSLISSSNRREFPNPDNYGNPRTDRKIESDLRNGNDRDGSSMTNSFEYSKKSLPKEMGDFNVVGIPTKDQPKSSSTHFLNDVKSLINRYENNNSEEGVDGDRLSIKSHDETKNRLEGKVISGIPLVAMAPKRSSSAMGSSGFGSPREVSTDIRGSVSSKTSSKGSKGTLHTDL